MQIAFLSGRTRQPIRALLAVLILGTGHQAMAAGPSIENSKLRVHYDEATGSFSITEKKSGQRIIKDGDMEAVPGSAKAQNLVDPVFGSGKMIKATRKEGGAVRLEVYPDLPFVLVRGELFYSVPPNASAPPEAASVKELKSVPTASFVVNLGRSPSDLRTMGTAGLTAPDANPGSYLFLTLADPNTRRGVVAGWLTAERGSGVLFSDVENGLVRFRARIDYGRLRLRTGRFPAGAERDGSPGPGADIAKLESLAIGVFDDARVGQELFAEAIARQLKIHLRSQPAGYCTWYSDRHGGASDEKSILELGEFVARELKPFGLTVVQIDDKWQDGLERNGPARRFLRAKPDGPYPHGMQPVAARLRELGLTAGIWFLPFASDYQDPEFKDRQDWFVSRLENGSRRPFETPWGNTSLDLTNPQVEAYLRDIGRTMRDWGYTYFKMDGLWTGTASEQIYVNDGYQDDHLGDNLPLADPTKTNIEALRHGLTLLRQAAGSDVFFSGCNVSQNMRTLGGCMGLVDSMRIGPDNGHTWGDYREEIAKNGSGSIITGPIRGTRLYFLNGRTWWNDPDPSYVRGSIPIQHARLITSWVALSGQFYLNSDWLPDLPPERIDIIKRTIPAHQAVARPVDYFETTMPRIWVVTDARPVMRRDVLGLFNWERDEQTLRCPAARADLDPAKRYFAFDFWSNTPLPVVSGNFVYAVPPESCRVIALRAEEGHPVLVSTSRHVTQGIVDVSDEHWSNATLSGTSHIIANDPCELRIAGLAGDPGTKWTLKSATLPVTDQRTGAAIQIEPARSAEAGWARVSITSSRTGEISWSLQFQRH